MAKLPGLLLAFLLLLPLPAAGQTARVYRDWIAGREAGGSSERQSSEAGGVRAESREWLKLERMGVEIRQDFRQETLRRPDGSLHFTWTLSLSQEPLEGQGDWSPAAPGKLELTFRDGAPRTLPVPAGALLWPGDLDRGLMAAARTGKPVRQKTFSFPTQSWTELELKPVGRDPLPGFADTVRFRGTSTEAGLAQEVEVWISPVQGEVKNQTTLAGIPFLSQRVELPAPEVSAAGAGLFERTIKTLPPHPFLLWLPEVKVRWTGTAPQALPQDPQQGPAGAGRFLLRRAQPPTPAEAAEAPVRGRPSPEDAPFLAATPLVQFHDPVFHGLERRLGAPAGASRWQLAQRVTDFVYDWIREKNYTVGFASAQEVARNPVGACAQHGVLAVALLRRLGVPARGVTGWMALGDTLGLHFWVEARIGGRWIPLDPTFDQAPASAYRLKLGTTDLADLGSVGLGEASMTFLEGVWLPDAGWTADVRVQGDTLSAPAGVSLRMPAGRWQLAGGRLALLWGGSHPVQAAPRPAPAQLAEARRLQGAPRPDGAAGRDGWWQPGDGRLWLDLGAGRWLQVDGLDEAQAVELLGTLELREPAGPAAKAA